MDWVHYTSILYHLVSNAIKFNKANGRIMIKLRYESIKDSSVSHLKTGILVTELVDTGFGMTKSKKLNLGKTFQISTEQTILEICGGPRNMSATSGIGLGLQTV